LPRHSENRLKDSASPYLRSAAHQPIDWYEWGDAAFERAKADDKPMLLDIGAVWCHWCHVIDRESYENPDIAKIISDNFIAVKVDRDERPDVDARYQAAISTLSGQGGWPLTGFLLPGAWAPAPTAVLKPAPPALAVSPVAVLPLLSPLALAALPVAVLALNTPLALAK